MTTYIDLLRAHQQEKAKLESHGNPTIGEENIGNELATNINPNTTTLPIDEPSHGQVFKNPYSRESGQHVSYETVTGGGAILEENESEASDVAEDTITATDVLLEESETNNPTVISAPSDAPLPTHTATSNGAASTNQTATEPTQQHSEFSLEHWLEQISHIVSDIFSAAEQAQAADISLLQDSLRIILEQIHALPSIVGALELEISLKISALCSHDKHNADLVQKAIMMMLYTIKTGLQLKIIHQELLNHMIAAMLHHSGMARIPADVRHKAGKLNKNEILLIRQAPEYSVQFLHQSNIDNEHIIRAVTQSTERYDGSGQTGLKGFEIVWAARLIGLLSMFEALIHIRAYRPRLLPRDAIRELVNHHKKAFDPVMLKALIESISLYPVGTFVQINTGEIGLVIAIHNKFPLRPIINISMDKYGNSITERRIDLKIQPNLMIQKCMYKEALDELRLAQAAA